MDSGNLRDWIAAVSTMILTIIALVYTWRKDRRDKAPELLFLLTNTKVSEKGMPIGYSVLVVNNSVSNSIVLRNPYRYWMVEPDLALDRLIKSKGNDGLHEKRFTADILIKPGESKVICSFSKKLYRTVRGLNRKRITLQVVDITTNKVHEISIFFADNKKNPKKGHLEIDTKTLRKFKQR